MIKCQYCEYENSDNLNYCINCSKPLTKKQSENTSDNPIKSLNQLYYSSVERLNLTNNNQKLISDNFILNDDYQLFISVLLSTLIPGSGLIYLKQQKLGFIILILTISLWTLTQLLYMITKISIVNITFSFSIILYFFNIIYTYKTVEDNQNNKLQKQVYSYD